MKNKIPEWLCNVLRFVQKYPCLLTRNKILNDLVSGEFDMDRFQKALDVSKTTHIENESERRQKIYDEIKDILIRWGKFPPARIVCSCTVSILIEHGFDKQKTIIIGLPTDVWNEKMFYIDSGEGIFKRGLFSLKNTPGGYVEV